MSGPTTRNFEKVNSLAKKLFENNWTTSGKSFNQANQGSRHITKITEPALSLPKRDKSVIKSRHFSDIIVNKMLTINVLTSF